MSIRVAICAKSTQDENWWYSIYQVNICPVVSFYCVKLILCFCVVGMLLMSQRLGQTSHISWDKLSEFIISFINSFDKTKLDGGVADYPEEILVAGGSSALIEFVILVYRFAIKICHGCNFWHSLFSLVLNLSLQRPLISPFKGCAELCIAYHMISQPSFTNYIRIFPVFISGWILPVKCSCRVMK